jgi:hypothetical protein
MKPGARSEIAIPSGLCVACGKPLDSKHFDESIIVGLPDPGQQVVLARYQLPPQYCGLLEYFSQFTDAYGQSCANVRTAGLQWRLLQNGHPIYPYVNLEHIVNPWGYGSFQVAIRLPEGALVEFVARRVGTADPGYGDLNGVNLIGGRIVGRYWYNVAYGGFESGGRP